jgi:hypothetical protein
MEKIIGGLILLIIVIALVLWIFYRDPKSRQEYDNYIKEARKLRETNIKDK